MNNTKITAARVILTVLCIIVIGAIFYNSSLDAANSTEMSNPIVDGINHFFESIHVNITVTDKTVRKAAHFTEYALLGTLLSVTAYLYVSKRKETLVVALPLGCAVAVCDEVIQLFPKGRSCEVKDMLIDGAGILVSVLIVQFILFLIERHKGKKEGKRSERIIAE